ncbi:MAG TPA: hypothetical protein VGL17_02900 [Gemmatimonadaceae bacterium]
MSRGIFGRSVAVVLAVCMATMTVLASLSAECQLHRVASGASPVSVHHHHLATPADTRGHQEKKGHSACDSCGCCIAAFRLVSASLTFAPSFVSSVNVAPLPSASPVDRIRSDYSLPFSTAPPAPRVTLPA